MPKKGWLKEVSTFLKEHRRFKYLTESLVIWMNLTPLAQQILLKPKKQNKEESQ